MSTKLESPMESIRVGRAMTASGQMVVTDAGRPVIDADLEETQPLTNDKAGLYQAVSASGVPERKVNIPNSMSPPTAPM